MKKYIILTLTFLAFAFAGKTQMLNINYQMSLPFGKTHDYISDASFRGADIEYHKFIGERMSVGIALGWNVFYKRMNNYTENFMLNNEDYTITGDQFRYINTVPMLGIARYYFTESTAALRPYLGVGIGTCWSEYKLNVGQFQAKHARWQFQVSPEVGTMIPLNDQISANLGVRYTFATKAANGRVPEISSLTFNIGIILTGSY